MKVNLNNRTLVAVAALMKSLLSIAVATIVFGGVLMFFKQRDLLFPIPDYPVPNSPALGVEKIQLGDAYGLFVKANKSGSQPQPVLIFSHGNGELAYWLQGDFDAIVDQGISVLILEYPGYGGNGGSPSHASISAAVLLAYDHLVTRPDVDRQRVLAYGRSIGGGAATILAANRPVAALGLESTFSSLPNLVAEKGYPSLLLRDRFENAELVSQLDIPVFLSHGIQDGLIPIHHSEQIESVASNPTFLKQNCGHNDCPPSWSAFIQFLASETDVLATSGEAVISIAD